MISVCSDLPVCLSLFSQYARDSSEKFVKWFKKPTELIPVADFSIEWSEGQKLCAHNMGTK